MIASSRIATVVPAHNEAARLGPTLREIPACADDVVVVDDASVDETYDVAREVAREDPRIEICRLGFNRGVGGAIVRGYRRVLELDADVAVVVAGDGQMDPDDFRRVASPVARGDADYAKGNRVVHPESTAMPTTRYLGTRLLACLTGWIAGYPELEDSQCGYTAASAELLEHLELDAVYRDFGYPNDLLIRAGARGAELVQPVVRPVYGNETSGFSVPEVLPRIAGVLLRGGFRRVCGSHGRDRVGGL